MKGVCVLKEYWRAFTNNKNQQQNNQSNKLQKLSNQPRMKGRKWTKSKGMNISSNLSFNEQNKKG